MRGGPVHSSSLRDKHNPCTVKTRFRLLSASLLILLTACVPQRGDRPSERPDQDSPELRLSDPVDIGEVFLYDAVDPSGTGYTEQLKSVVDAGLFINVPDIPPIRPPKGCDVTICYLLLPRDVKRFVLQVPPTQAPHDFVFFDQKENEIGRATRITEQVGEATTYGVELPADAPLGRTEITARNEAGESLISTSVDLIDK